MTKLNVIGVDLAKNVIQVSVLSPSNRELRNSALTRRKFAEFLARRRLMELEGIGPIGSVLLYATLGTGEAFANAHLFSTLDQVREISEQWRIKYNEYRPHDALGRIPPAVYMRNLKLENSSLELST